MILTMVARPPLSASPSPPVTYPFPPIPTHPPIPTIPTHPPIPTIPSHPPVVQQYHHSAPAITFLDEPAPHDNIQIRHRSFTPRPVTLAPVSPDNSPAPDLPSELNNEVRSQQALAFKLTCDL